MMRHMDRQTDLQGGSYIPPKTFSSQGIIIKNYVTLLSILPDTVVAKVTEVHQFVKDVLALFPW